MQITVPDNIKALSVSTLQISAGNTQFYSVGFRNLIENHIGYLQSLLTTKTVNLNPKKEQIFQGDFYSMLFSTENISQDLFWVTMRLNNLMSPIDYNKVLGSILIPKRSDIESLLNKYLNSITM